MISVFDYLHAARGAIPDPLLALTLPTLALTPIGRESMAYITALALKTFVPDLRADLRTGRALPVVALPRVNAEGPSALGTNPMDVILDARCHCFHPISRS
jgi:hypothetical protein